MQQTKIEDIVRPSSDSYYDELFTATFRPRKQTCVNTAEYCIERPISPACGGSQENLSLYTVNDDRQKWSLQ